MTRSACSLCLLAWMLAAGAAVAEIENERRWRGPVRLRSLYTLDIPMLDMTPDTGATLGRGNMSVEFLVSHSNTFQVSSRYTPAVVDFLTGTPVPDYELIADGELTRTAIRADFAVGSRVDLGIEVPLIAHSEGFLDDTIDEFHETFDLLGNARETRPTDEFLVDVISGGRRLFVDDADGGLGDVIFRAKFGVHEGPTAAFSTLVEIKAPTGDEDALTGSGEWDYGLSLLLSAGGGDHSFHGGIGYQVLGQPAHYPVEIDDRGSLFAGYEWEISERWSFVTHVMAATSILPDHPGNSMGDPRGEITAGAHYGGPDWQISFGAVEDITTNDNAVDVSFFFGGRWWF